MPTLMLIDGNSLTYRAFHALPQDLATASGQVTNAVFGFTSMLINLVRDHQPDGVVVAFDRPEPTFRHERVETYKANRSAAPDILKQQMGLVREVLDALRLPQIEQAGVEADDILATLAERAAGENIDVLIVTGDRDSYQLVRDPHIKVVYNKRGVSDYAVYDEAGIEERTGVRPDKYVLYAALRGDTSDNLPGVPGVGEKTAAKLINSYGDLDGLFDHVADQTPKLRENLGAHETQVRVNAEIMELQRDVELNTEIQDLLGIEAYDPDEVRKLFDFLEFRTLLTRLEEAFANDSRVAAELPELAIELVAATSVDEALQAVERLDGEGPVAVQAVFDSAGSNASLDADGSRLGGLAFAGSPPGVTGAWPVVWIDKPTLLDASVSARLVEILIDRGLAAHEAKPLLRHLVDGPLNAGANLVFDTALAAYLLDPAGNSYSLADLLPTYAELRLPETESAPEGQLDFGSDSISPAERAALDAAAVAALVAPLRTNIEQNGLGALHDDVEVPLVGVLARMERLGVAVDQAELERLNADMTAEAEALAAQIQEAAGEEFNVNSTKKLREILFDKLGLKPQKKTKTGYSTDQATLEKLAGDHPIVDHLLRYREVEKLRSTYGQSLLDSVATDGRIHATFNQTVARTGRLSSENPNLHNIPVRTELGRSFRRAFVPAQDRVLVVADYNQIELRCIAHLADDPGLIGAFRSGDDIHSMTAARIFDVDIDEVTTEQRSKSKMVSYGLAYGMEAYGLGQRLNIATSEAKAILDAYFESFPAVRDYMDRTVTGARNRGYTETLFGRRRAIPELMSDNRNLRQAGERQAMNAGIQGLAADIFKVALVRLDRILAQGGYEGRLVLQVHDEVILEVPEAEVDRFGALVTDAMRDAFELRVPLEVNLASGQTWADAKG